MKMYAELYEIWKKELENSELCNLNPDFYIRVADYLRKIKEESRMLDRKTAKASLLRKETRNVKRMLQGLVSTRYKKVVEQLRIGENLPLDSLTVEERKIFTGALDLPEAYKGFVESLFQGRVLKTGVKERKRTVLRFLKDVPAIIGVDMKTYGPFKVEDVATLPIGNAKILTDRKLAEKVGAG